MNLKELVTGKPGDKQFLLGNEAAVRGVIEAGVSVAATYPGTPSSEIGNVLSGLAKEANIYFEFSTNEKVAMEVAATAAASGLRSFTFMKHVGMNVASDSFMTTAYSGVNGGMVILSADYPSLFSSQNEQDTRNYGRLANVPILEPSNCQEVKDMVKYAFDLSEQFKLPVIVRTTTRVSHMRGVVEFGEVVDNSSEGESHWKKGFFKKNPAQFVPVPAFAKDMHVALVEKMDEIVQEVVKVYGHVDILLNNAGANISEPFLEYDVNDWDYILNLNLKSIFLLSQSVAKHMVAQKTKGKIINIASMLSFTGGILTAAYTASKSGVMGLTKTMANELAKYGINCN